MGEVQVSPAERIILKSPTDSVELKQLILEDAEAYFALIEADRSHFAAYSPETTRKYQTLEDVEKSIQNPDPNQVKYRFGFWDNGLMVSSNNLTVEDDRGILGSFVGRPYIGHNYAARGRTLLIDFAFNELGLKRVVSYVDVNNSYSRRSVERSGLWLLDTIVIDKHETCIYALENPQYRSWISKSLSGFLGRSLKGSNGQNGNK